MKRNFLLSYLFLQILLVLFAINTSKLITEEQETPESFNEKIEKFNQWLTKHSKKTKLKLKITNENTFETSVVASENIEKDEVVFSLDNEFVISSELIFNGKYADFVNKLLEKYDYDEITYLIIIILDEYYNPQSKWREYLDILPKLPKSPVLLYLNNSKKIDAEINGTTILRKIVDYKFLIEKRASRLIKGLFSQQPELFDPEIFNQGNVEWAIHLIDSRIQQIDYKSAFVPLLDNINFNASSKTEIVKTNDEVNKIINISFSTSEEKENEITFNPKQNSDNLLMYNGIFLENNEKHDCFSFTLSFNERVDDRLLKDRNDYFKKYFLFDSDYVDIIEDCLFISKPFDNRILFFYYVLMLDANDLQKENPKREGLHEDKLILTFAKDNLLSMTEFKVPTDQLIAKLETEKDNQIRTILQYQIGQRRMLDLIIRRFDEQIGYLIKEESL